MPPMPECKTPESRSPSPQHESKSANSSVHDKSANSSVHDKSANSSVHSSVDTDFVLLNREPSSPLPLDLTKKTQSKEDDVDDGTVANDNRGAECGAVTEENTCVDGIDEDNTN